MKLVLVAIALINCGGMVDEVAESGADASQDKSQPTCFVTEYGCSFCVADAAPGVCGNIGRYDDAGNVSFGCCVGATPFCSEGVCVQSQP